VRRLRLGSVSVKHRDLRRPAGRFPKGSLSAPDVRGGHVCTTDPPDSLPGLGLNPLKFIHWRARADPTTGAACMAPTAAAPGATPSTAPPQRRRRHGDLPCCGRWRGQSGVRRWKDFTDLATRGHRLGQPPGHARATVAMPTGNAPVSDVAHAAHAATQVRWIARRSRWPGAAFAGSRGPTGSS
jgi:hypothetical protein